MKRRSKILLVVGLVLLPPALLVALCAFPWDEPPPDDSDLLIRRDAIPDSQDGLVLFEAAAEKISWPRAEDARSKIDAILADEAWDAQFADNVLSENKGALDLWHQGMARPGLRAPEAGPPSPNTKNCYSPPFISLAEIICIRCRALMQSGHEREALNEAATLAEFGLRIRLSKGQLADSLVGLSLEEMGLERLRRDASAAHLPPAEMKEYIVRLGRLRDGGRPAADAVRADYTQIGPLLDLMKAGAVGANLGTPAKGESLLLRSGYHFQPNGTRRLIVQKYRRLIELAPKPYAQTAAWISQEEKQLGNPNSGWGSASFLSPNCLGREAVLNLAARLADVIRLDKHAGFLLQANRLALAIRCFERTTGRLPQRLDELVPEWIDAVPPDDFDGKPIRWSAARRLLWSVGKNLADDGGDGTEDDPAGSKDLVFHLDPKDAKKAEEVQGAK